jgi:Cu-processing system permease protein
MALSSHLIRMIAFEALRSRLAWVALVLAGVAFGVAQFISQVALIESSQIEVALIAALLRAAAVFIVATFVISSMVRESNDKITELLLSQPMPRATYFLSKLCGYTAVSLLLAAAFALPLAVLATPGRAALWGVSLACELSIVAAVSLFCVISLSQVLPAFAATAGFYLLSRSLQSMQDIAAAPLIPSEGWTASLVRGTVDAIALVMPSLDRFSLTRWLIENPPTAAEIQLVLAQTVVYLTLIGAASLFDLYRKNF